MALQILYFVPGNLLNPESSFQALSERLVVSPVLQTLVYSKNPSGAREWVDKVASGWSFKRVIPAHFEAPVAAGPKDFRYALTGSLWSATDSISQKTKPTS
jgi:hypothetical protein